MSDRHNDQPPEETENPQSNRPTPEGVRIIGAEEAQAAIEAGQATGRRPDDEPRFGDVPPPPEGPRPPLRFPLGGGGDPSTVAPRAPLSHSEAEEGTGAVPPATRRPSPAAGGVEMPHWTEPPTGEVPQILPQGEGAAKADDELDAWSSFTHGARWRDQPGDWEEADFHEGELKGEDTRMGALADRPDHSDLFLFDEPEPSPRAGGAVSAAASAPPAADVPGHGAEAVPPAPPPTSRPEPPSRRPRVPGTGPRPARAPEQGSSGGTPGGAGGRDLPVAVGVGLGVGLVVLVAAKLGPAALLLVAGAVILLSAAELYNKLRLAGYHPATALGLVATVSLLAAAYRNGEPAFPMVLVLVVVFGFLWYLTGVIRARPSANLAVTVLAFLWVGFMGAFTALLLRLPARHGVVYLLLAIIATVAYDTGAFFVGRRAGKTPLAPSISPNKTWEGLVGATVATVVVTLLVVALFGMHPWTIKRAFLLALVVAVVAPLGDLCESMVKRDLGVKDMGSLLPGHGGLLDRIDALIFVVPATYYLLRLLKVA